MRDRKGWMNKASEPVLELLDEGIVANGRAITYTLKHRADQPEDAPGRSTVYRSLDALEEHCFVEPAPENDSYYRITEKGEAWLRGE